MKMLDGDPLDESTDVGPLIRESDANRADRLIQESVRGGARVLLLEAIVKDPCWNRPC